MSRLIFSFGIVDEVDLSCDATDFIARLEPQERQLLLQVLPLFNAWDSIANENLIGHFHEELEFPEARAFWSIAAADTWTVVCRSPTALHMPRWKIFSASFASIFLLQETGIDALPGELERIYCS